MAEITLRQGRVEDAAACGRICYEAFRGIATTHGFPPPFDSAEQAGRSLGTKLADRDVYAVVAEHNGRLAGAAFLSCYAAVVGVDPIVVDPHAQRSGVGRLLMLALLEHAREHGFEAVRLVQAAYNTHSLALYTKLGFDVREPLAVMQGPPIGGQTAGRTVRPATNANLEACGRLCSSVHGFERGRELLQGIEQGTATVVEQDGRISGYASAIGLPGHAVAASNDDLKALIAYAPVFHRLGFLLPSRNAELLRWCLDSGLHIVQPMTLMSLGPYQEPAGAYLPSVAF